MEVRGRVCQSLLMLLGLFTLPLQAGHVVGNGGDYVRGSFIQQGQAVLAYLTNTEAGGQIVTANKIDLVALKANLDIGKLDIVEGTLLDNGGVPVDATGSIDKITLQNSRWTEHFEKDRDVYYLVFHELLRTLQINDDNYVISKALLPFPSSRRVSTRINPLIPLLDEERLDKIFDPQSLSVNGSGCKLGRLGTRAEFDLERNTLSLVFDNYLVVSDLMNSASSTVARKNCGLALPIQVPSGFSLVVAQFDLEALIDSQGQSDIDLSQEVFLSGSQSPVNVRNVSVGDAPLLAKTLVRRNDVLKTACGESTNLRLNSSALLRQGAGKAGAVQINRMTFYLKLEKCQ